MARRNVRTLETEADPQADAVEVGRDLAEIRNDLSALYDPHAATLDKDFSAEEDELNAVLAEAGGSEGAGSVVVRKLGDKTRKFEWLIKYTVSEFVTIGGVAHLAAKYGGGEYELIVYGADNRIVKRPKVTVSSAAVTEFKAQEAGQLSGLDRLAAVMTEGFKQLALQQAQMLRPQESKADWLRELTMMRELFGGGNQPNAFEQLSRIIPVVRDLMPKGEGETNFLDVMMQLAKEYAPVIKSAVDKMPLPAPVPVGEQVTQPSLALSPEQTGANQMQLMLRAQLAMLCNEARADSDPAPYAAIICSKVDPAVLSTLANNPQWLDELAKVHSGVKLYPKWFGELRDAVVEIMTEPPEEAQQPPEGDNSSYDQ